MRFNLLTKIGAVLAVVGILGYAIFFPFTTVQGDEFMEYEKDSPSDIIEIHNRPNYFHLIYKEKIRQKIILYFHNDPLTMTGSISASDRKKLLDNATKIVFNSQI